MIGLRKEKKRMNLNLFRYFLEKVTHIKFGFLFCFHTVSFTKEEEETKNSNNKIVKQNKIVKHISFLRKTNAF